MGSGEHGACTAEGVEHSVTWPAGPREKLPVDGYWFLCTVPEVSVAVEGHEVRGRLAEGRAFALDGVEDHLPGTTGAVFWPGDAVGEGLVPDDRGAVDPPASRL